MNPQPPLIISNLTCGYGNEEPIFHRISAGLTEPRRTAIVGPNGIGKSTLLKAIMGFITPQSGSITLFGESLSATQHKIAYIPQLQSIDWQFPLSALDVTLMGLYPQIGIGGFIREHHKDTAREYLHQVGMLKHEAKPIGELSGGQRQRILIARSLAMNAQLYILDEPYNGIDDVSSKIINQLFSNMNRNGVTILAVHHDLAKLTDYFDDIWLMHKNRILSGSAQEILTPENIARSYNFAL